MSEVMSATLGVSETSEDIMLYGSCDVFVTGLTSGSVKLEMRFPNEATWRDAPDGSYSTNIWKTMFVSEHGVSFRFVGVSNNAGVYVRLSREVLR